LQQKAALLSGGFSHSFHTIFTQFSQKKKRKAAGASPPLFD